MIKPVAQRILVVWGLIIGALLAWLWFSVSHHHVRVNADVLDVLQINDPYAEAAEQASQGVANRALLFFAHPEADVSKASIKYMLAHLAGHPLIASCYLNPGAELHSEELVAFYAQYGNYLLSDDARHALQNGDYHYLARNYFSLLSQPGNPLVSASIARAPLLNVADWLTANLQSNHWQNDAPFLYVSQGETRYYPLFIELSGASLNANNAETASADLQHLIDTLQQQYPQLVVLRSGVIFHTAAISEQAKAESTLLSMVSLVAVALLSLWRLRTLLPIAALFLTIGVSVVAGLAALASIFNEIQVLALVFAVSLTGVAVDYAYHVLLTARYYRLSGLPLARKLLPALVAGGLTTILSYLLLLTLPVVLLKQVAVFMVVGVLAAVTFALTALCWWPLPGRFYAPLRPLPQLTGLNGVVLFLLAAVVLASSSQLTFSDDIRLFNSSPPHLLEQEARIAKLVGSEQYPRLLFFRASNKQQVLQRMAQIRGAIKQHIASPSALQGLDLWLPDERRQMENQQLLQKAVQSAALAEVLSYLNTSAIVSLNTPTPLLKESNLPRQLTLLAPPVLSDGEHWIGAMRYAGALSAQQLAAISQLLDFELHFYDKPALLSAAMQKLRVYVLQFLLVALFCVTAMMLIRYGWRSGAAGALLPGLAIGLALVCNQLFFGYLTLFHLLGSVLVLALLIDYVVFLQEHGKRPHVLESITLSAVTSVFAFGLLAFSETQAILHFGSMVFCGVSIGWLLCFTLPPEWLRSRT